MKDEIIKFRINHVEKKKIIKQYKELGFKTLSDMVRHALSFFIHYNK